MDRKTISALVAVIAVLAAVVFLGQEGKLPGKDDEVQPIEINESEKRLRDDSTDYSKVVIEDGEFNPSSLTISTGEDINKVVWTNQDGATHYLTLVREDTVFSRTLPAGENFTWNPYDPGEYTFSAPNINDTGTITVE
ncbi:MAG: cupredoxin domain-containing protein [Candidatus Nanohaloarchaeota archaeon QJJ-7]|nr:cupredoxin domain-containing protein [Candidatus Nanohaloarchaeota archaeon QJJ-7]